MRDISNKGEEILGSGLGKVSRGCVTGHVIDGDTCRLYGVVSRQGSPAEDHGSLVGPGKGKKKRKRRKKETEKAREQPRDRDNSCRIANEPSRHPNDGWLGLEARINVLCAPT